MGLSFEYRDISRSYLLQYVHFKIRPIMLSRSSPSRIKEQILPILSCALSASHKRFLRLSFYIILQIHIFSNLCFGYEMSVFFF